MSRKETNMTEQYKLTFAYVHVHVRVLRFSRSGPYVDESQPGDERRRRRSLAALWFDVRGWKLRVRGRYVVDWNENHSHIRVLQKRFQHINYSCVVGKENDKFNHTSRYDTGDVRVNEQPGLASMHTIFVRLHNYFEEGLFLRNRDSNPTSDHLYYVRFQTKHAIGYVTYVGSSMSIHSLPLFYSFGYTIASSMQLHIHVHVQWRLVVKSR